MRFYFDTNALIQAVETSGPDADTLRKALKHAATTNLGSVTSELSLSEVLVRPIRERDIPLIAAYSGLLAGAEGDQLQTLPITRDVLTRAARIRAASPALKLPDAIHLATAELSGCTQIISSDKRLAGSTALTVWDPAGADLAGFIEMMS
ncbi:type II toxin-antitoxin system VapC family toxin [Ancylobacter radicis]|uniref:Ribonuclease VapC n=1 Tax=Ancylobacter radicis TaxID=2836179 RepID=A0ABS5RBZ0_9HYPH|nr:PIN domain-containing protein [Ancylobacter radicis]